MALGREEGGALRRGRAVVVLGGAAAVAVGRGEVVPLGRGGTVVALGRAEAVTVVRGPEVEGTEEEEGKVLDAWMSVASCGSPVTECWAGPEMLRAPWNNCCG